MNDTWEWLREGKGETNGSALEENIPGYFLSHMQFNFAFCSYAHRMFSICQQQ